MWSPPLEFQQYFQRNSHLPHVSAWCKRLSDCTVWPGKRAMDEFSNLVAGLYHTRKNRAQSNFTDNEMWLHAVTTLLVIPHTPRATFWSKWIIPDVIYMRRAHSCISQTTVRNLINSGDSPLWTGAKVLWGLFSLFFFFLFKIFFLWLNVYIVLKLPSPQQGLRLKMLMNIQQQIYIRTVNLYLQPVCN